MRKLLLGSAATAMAAVFAFPAVAGNDAPTGAHYSLNIIGTNDKTAPANASGHVIFVKIDGNTRINLCQSGVDGACADVDGFQVLDKNGTDGSASFALPNPDPDGDGTTTYSVFARALGKPGGSSGLVMNRSC